MLQAHEEQVRAVVAERLRVAEQRRMVRSVQAAPGPIRVWSFAPTLFCLFLAGVVDSIWPQINCFVFW